MLAEAKRNKAQLDRFRKYKPVDDAFDAIERNGLTPYVQRVTVTYKVDGVDPRQNAKILEPRISIKEFGINDPMDINVFMANHDN